MLFDTFCDLLPKIALEKYLDFDEEQATLLLL